MNQGLQGCRGTARTRGPADLWHGTAQNILARKILARPGTENFGTQKYTCIHLKRRSNPQDGALKG